MTEVPQIPTAKNKQVTKGFGKFETTLTEDEVAGLVACQLFDQGTLFDRRINPMDIALFEKYFPYFPDHLQTKYRPVAENFQKLAKQDIRRLHYVNTKDARGFFTTQHQSVGREVNKDGTVNLQKTRKAKYEYSIYQKLQELNLGKWLLDHTYEDGVLTRKGVTRLSLADLLNCADESNWKDVIDWINSEYNLGIKKVSVCPWQNATLDDVIFTHYMSRHIILIWLRLSAFAHQLSKLDCSFYLTPDNVDLSGRLLDFEHFKFQREGSYVDAINPIFVHMQSLWSTFYLNKIFTLSAPDAFFDGDFLTADFDEIQVKLFEFFRDPHYLSDSDLAYVKSRMMDAVNMTKVPITLSKKEFYRVGLTITFAFGWLRDCLSGSDFFLPVSDNEFVLCQCINDTLFAQAPPYQHRISIDKVFGLEKMLGFARIKNLWEIEYEDDLEIQKKIILSAAWNGREQSGLPACEFLPDYVNGEALILHGEGIPTHIPSVIRTPVIGEMPYKSILTCEDPSCKEIKYESKILSILSEAPFVLNFVQSKGTRVEVKSEWVGQLSARYQQPSKLQPYSTFIDDMFVTYAEEKGVLLDHDVGYLGFRDDMAFIVTHRFFRMTESMMEKDQLLFDMQVCGGRTDAVWMSEFFLLRDVKMKELAEVCAKHPKASYDFYLPSQQVVKNPNSSPGFPFVGIGKSKEVREMIGLDARDRLYLHTTHSAAQQVVLVGGKVALTPNSKGRTIGGVSVLHADWSRALFQGQKVINMIHGCSESLEGNIFYRGGFDKLTNFLRGIDCPDENKVMCGGDYEKYDKNLATPEFIIDGLVALDCVTNIPEGVSKSMIYRGLLNDIANITAPYSVMGGNVIRRTNGNTSGNSRTKTVNGNINLCRNFGVEVQGLLSDFYLDEVVSDFRNRLAFELFFRPAVDWNLEDVREILVNYNTYRKAKLFRMVCVGDDYIKVKDSRNTIPFPKEIQYVKRHTGVEMKKEKCTLQNDSLVPSEFCSHHGVVTPYGVAACPDVSRLMSTMAWVDGDKSVDDIQATAISVAFMAWPTQFDTENKPPIDLCEFFLAYARSLGVEDVSSKLGKLIPGLVEEYDLDVGDITRLFSSDRFKEIHMCARPRDIVLKKSLVEKHGLTGDVAENESGFMFEGKSCSICSNPFVVRCMSCPISVFFCQHCVYHHYKMHGHDVFRAPSSERDLFSSCACPLENWTVQCAEFVCTVCTESVGPSIVDDAEEIINLYFSTPERRVPGVSQQFVDLLVKSTTYHDGVYALAYETARRNLGLFLNFLQHTIFTQSAREDKVSSGQITSVRKVGDKVYVTIKWSGVQPGMTANSSYTIKRGNRTLGSTTFTYTANADVRLGFVANVFEICEGDTVVPSKHSVSMSALIPLFSKVRGSILVSSILRGLLVKTTDICNEVALSQHLCGKSDNLKHICTSVFKQPLTLVSGCPGAGKTTLNIALIKTLIDCGKKVLFLAPSHVAVDEPADKLAKDRRYYEGVYRNLPRDHAERVNVKIAKKYDSASISDVNAPIDVLFSTMQCYANASFRPDVVIIDEYSLANTEVVFKSLIDYPKANFLFMGDVNQLGAVIGTGVSAPFSNFLNYLIKHEKINHYNLTDHYRMCDSIAGFISRTFYSSTLVSFVRDDPSFAPHISIINSSSRATRYLGTSSYNQEENDKILGVYDYLRDKHPDATFKIICSFNGSVHTLKNHNLEDVYTVDSSQGTEADIVLFALGNNSKHSLDRNRVNVAISRAKQKVVIFDIDDAFAEMYFPNSIVRTSLYNFKLNKENRVVGHYQMQGSNEANLGEFVSNRDWAKKMADKFVVYGADSVADVPSNDIFAVDLEGARHSQYNYNGLPLYTQLGFCVFNGVSPFSQNSRYFKPMSVTTDGHVKTWDVSALRRPTHKGVPMFSDRQWACMRKTKATQEEVTRDFLNTVFKRCELFFVFLVYDYVFDLGFFMGSVESVSNPRCSFCSCQMALARFSGGGLFCKACAPTDQYIKTLVNPIFVEMQLTKQNLETAHQGCTLGHDLSYHDPGQDAMATFCIFMHARRRCSPRASYPVNCAPNHFMSRRYREVVSDVVAGYVDATGNDEILDVGVGRMRQAYNFKSPVYLTNLEPVRSDVAVNRASKLNQQIFFESYENHAKAYKLAIMHQVYHHVPPGSLRDENVLIIGVSRESCNQSFRYTPFEGDNRFHTVGTNNVYLDEHFDTKDIIAREPGYDVSLLDPRVHKCSGDSIIAILPHVRPEVLPHCVLTDDTDMCTVHGRQTCVDAYQTGLRYADLSFRGSSPITFWLLRKKNRNEFSHNIWFNSDPRSKPFNIMFPNYQARRNVKYISGVPSDRGYHKVADIINVLFNVEAVAAPSSVLIVGGHNYQASSVPMASAVFDFFDARCVSVDPSFLEDEKQCCGKFSVGKCKLLASRFQDVEHELATPDFLISDAYIPTGDYFASLVSFILFRKVASFAIKITVSSVDFVALGRLSDVYETLFFFRPQILGESSEAWLLGHTVGNGCRFDIKPVYYGFMQFVNEHGAKPKYLSSKNLKWLHAALTVNSPSLLKKS